MTMRRRQLLLALPVLLMPSLASAQQQGDGGSNRPDSEEFLSRLLLVIDQAGIIIPGRGFKSIGIGDSVEQLLELWGKPSKINRKSEVLTYLLQQNTLIHFKLDDGLIKSIVVMGRPGSLAKINNGVIFGMSQEQVLGQFKDEPDKQTSKLIRYNESGIELGFLQGRLAEILVFSPR